MKYDIASNLYVFLKYLKDYFLFFQQSKLYLFIYVEMSVEVSTHLKNLGNNITFESWPY